MNLIDGGVIDPETADKPHKFTIVSMQLSAPTAKEEVKIAKVGMIYTGVVWMPAQQSHQRQCSLNPLQPHRHAASKQTNVGAHGTTVRVDSSSRPSGRRLSSMHSNLSRYGNHQIHNIVPTLPPPTLTYTQS
jgi:hypothetical protein